MIQAAAPLNIAIIASVHVLELSSVTESCELTSVAGKPAGRIQGALSFFTGDSLLCGLNRVTKDLTPCNRVEIILVPVGYVATVN